MPDAPVLRTAWAALGGDEGDLSRVSSTAPEVTRLLDSPLAVGTLVHDAIATASLAAGLLSEDTGGKPIEVRLDPARVATAVTSERWLTIDGDHPPVWAELSGFWPTSDGWLRTHANYPHHRDRLVAALHLTDESADDLRSVLSSMSARQAADAITAEGGVAVAVATEEEWRGSEQGRAAAAAPLIRLERLAAADAESARILDSERPLAGVRVLDFTRVIAGPVATRTLALFGASVLRIDSPRLPEIAMQHLDTGADKESALLDLARDRQTLDDLLTTADVVVTGYRPGALARFGLDPKTLADRGIISATLSAWGGEGPWHDRRGFDSLVQAASGISWLSSADGETPGALPAQALDHSAGYLLAAGVMTALRTRRRNGDVWAVEVSLARVAEELLGLPRGDDARFDQAEHGARHVPDESTDDTADDTAEESTDADNDPDDPPFQPTMVESETDAGVISYAMPAAGYTGSATEWLRPPVPWGSSPASW
ncbi:hypothetical protein E6C64_02085 [Naasia lichenicola]|uniref:CoA transferase n=2 Tax=Naasia lichenicola TaxID=2565933 RepID=A0A4S4FVC2_9MICO|nr:hypothetical protein E6C64_02085 [Naasia lichenicola]